MAALDDMDNPMEDPPTATEAGAAGTVELPARRRPALTAGDRRRVASEIPVGTQFSPALIALPEFLAMIVKHSGDKPRMQQALFAPPVHLKRNAIPPSKRGASLPLEAAAQYGLLTARTYKATELAAELARLGQPEVHERFARHILLNLNGVRVVEAAEQMRADYEAGLSDVKITGDSLATFLSAQGMKVTEHNTAINTMRLWLAKAGLFPEAGGDRWRVDVLRKSEILGIDDPTLQALAGFDRPQRAFLKALCKVDPPGWYKASEIRNLAEATDESRVRLGRASLPNQVLKPLKAAGLIEWRSGGTRGGKAATLHTTAKFKAEVLAEFLDSAAAQSLDPSITEYYRTRPEDIYAALGSKDKGEKGRALEAYAIHLMRLLGLRLVEWRKRAPQTTGQAEIDALMAGVIGGVATMWQVQCKNTPGSKVDLEDIAKEVGLVAITHATHILFAANCQFTRDARTFARAVMESSSLSIYLLDESDFEAIKSSPATIGAIIARQSEAIVQGRLHSPTWSTSIRQ